MKRLIKLLQSRRKALQSIAWLRPVLLVVNLVLVVAGLIINPVLGFILGLIIIFFNELLTPVVMLRFFYKELSGEIRPTGTLTFKVFRGSKSENNKS